VSGGVALLVSYLFVFIFSKISAFATPYTVFIFALACVGSLMLLAMIIKALKDTARLGYS